MRLGHAARYVPTSVLVYPTSSSIVQFGGQGSLERFGNVLVAGADRFGFNRIATTTVKGTPFSLHLNRTYGGRGVGFVR